MAAWNPMEILKRRPCWALISCLTLSFLFMFVSDNSELHRLPNASTTQLLRSSKTYKNTSRREPLIYVYNDLFRSKDWYSFWTNVNGSQSRKTLTRCPTKCKFTWNQSDLKSADFVLVSLAGYHLYGGKAVKLKHAKGEQIWVGYLHEAPTYRKGYEAVDGIFDWVATHRRDSDICVPSGTFFPINSSQSDTGLVELRASLKKKKLATWLVSHCETSSEREVLVKTLQRHIPVDIFGACSDRNCTPPKGVDCRAYLGKRYKFYLAFENSLCLDYVTEKFFYPYHHNMVPVAFGWANYSLQGPPGSYINALDFNSVKDLADYLLFLDRNDDEYIKYFAWRGSYSVKLFYVHHMTCIVCTAMSNYVNKKKGDQIDLNMAGVKYQASGRKHWQQRPKTYKSVKKWHESLPVGQARTAFRIGVKIIFNVTTSCVRPSEHVPFKKWILGK